MNIKILLLSLAAVLIFGVLVGLYRTMHPYEQGFETTTLVNAETTGESGTEIIEIRGEQPGWQLIGKGPLAINAVGKITSGGHEAVPGKSETLAGDGSPAPGLPQGILLAKIGKPFKCGGVCKITTKDNIYLAINDSDYNDNSGVYTVTILRNSDQDK
jgi:hypothetical protein